MMPLGKKDRDTLTNFDPVSALDRWAAEASNKGMQWTSKFTWNEPRATMAIHPSSLSNPCDMVLYLELLGGGIAKKNSPREQAIYDVGTAVHEMFQYHQGCRAQQCDYLYNPEVGFHWKEKGSSVRPDLRMTGHMDGVSEGWPIASEVIWEYKTISDKGFCRLASSPHKDHLVQVHAYMVNLDIPFAIIMYINKNNSEKVAFKVPFSTAVWKPHEERIHNIVQLASRLEDPPKRVGASCYRCRFFEECRPKGARKPKAHPQGAVVV